MSLGIHLRALSLNDVEIPIDKTRLKISVLKWHLGLPGSIELTRSGWSLPAMDIMIEVHVHCTLFTLSCRASDVCVMQV